MKKIVQTFSLLAVFLLLSGQQAYAEVYSGVDGNISWSVDTETGVLALSGNGSMNSDYYYYDLVPWNSYRSDIKSVEFSDGITNIGHNAFRDCDKLTSVTIPASVTSIGQSAFYGCSSLTSVTIPESVTSIGEGAFSGCSSLTSVTIPAGVTGIGRFAFSSCSSLTSVTIPTGVTSIDRSAFSGCSSLTSVTIPESVSYINAGAFAGSGLTDITIPNSVQTIIPGAFSDTPWYENQEDGLLYLGNYLLGIKGSIPQGTLIIKDGTKGIAPEAFRGRGITNITIPNSVTSIGIHAFMDCSNLASVTISSSVKEIGEATFYGCTSLTSVTIPEGVTSIGFEAFAGCTGLTSVTIPEGVTRIDAAFIGCTGLTSITIPNSVIFMYSKIFYGTAWYNSQEDGLLYLDDWLLEYKGSEPEGALVIKDGTKGIADSAFLNCKSLTSVAIPESVTSIGIYAFYDCSSLTSVTMESTAPCKLGGSSIFPPSNDSFKIYVPYGSGDTYKNAEGWSAYADYIEEMLSEEDVTDNLLYMENSKMFHQSQLTIPVLMKNAKPFTAFQCDITLPEGLTLHKTMNEDDEEVFDIAYGSRAKSSHSLMANQLTNGNIRVAGYSSSNADYRDSEGMFFTLTVDVADDASGDLPIKLSNVILTSATDGDTECPDTEAVLTIIPGQPGDVNGDGKLTMGDVVKLVNHILEVSQTGFNADLADVNEDGKVTMGDVVIVLNMILSGDYPVKAPFMRQTMAKDDGEYDIVL